MVEEHPFPGLESYHDTRCDAVRPRDTAEQLDRLTSNWTDHHWYRLADALSLKPDERAQMQAVADGQAPPDPPGVNGFQLASAFERRLAEATDDLAHAVGTRWGREEELRRIQDPFPLPVRWQLAPEELMDHWKNICRTSPWESAEPLDLAGHLSEIADV